MKYKCKICGSEQELGTGYALHIVVCYSIDRSDMYLSYCNDCFKRIVRKLLRELNGKRELNIALDEIKGVEE
jgi:hypothetical protein